MDVEALLDDLRADTHGSLSQWLDLPKEYNGCHGHIENICVILLWQTETFRVPHV